MRHVWLLLLLIMPVAGQGEDINLVVDDRSQDAPANFTFEITAATPRAAVWNLSVDGVVLTNGSAIPATGTFVLTEPGEYTVVLAVADGGDVRRLIQVEVTEPPLPWLDGNVLPLLFAGLLMLSLAAWLLVQGRGSPLNVAFAILFIARGVTDIALASWTTQGRINIRPGGLLAEWTGGLVIHILPLSSILAIFAALYFLYVYLAQNHASLAAKRTQVGWIIFATAVAMMIIYLMWPAPLWWDAATGLPGGPLFVFTGLYYPLYAVFGLLLIRSSTLDIPDERRTGLYLSGLGFMFLPVFEAVGAFVFVEWLDVFAIILPAGLSRADLGMSFQIGHLASMSAIVPALLAAVWLGRDAIQNPTRRHVRLHFAGYMLTILLPLCSLAFGVVAFNGPQPAGAEAALGVFVIFQGIWTIPYPVLVALGLLRYQASEQQALMRRQLRRFGLASIFFTIFFTVSEGLEILAANKGNDSIGLAVAGVVTLLLSPVQRMVQQRWLEPTAAPEAETPQEIRFYEAQLRKTLRDGVIGDTERHFLDNLMETMGIQPTTARELELKVVAELAAA